MYSMTETFSRPVVGAVTVKVRHVDEMPEEAATLGLFLIGDLDAVVKQVGRHGIWHGEGSYGGTDHLATQFVTAGDGEIYFEIIVDCD